VPPVQWAPASGEFTTLWDWQTCAALGIPAVWRARMCISQAIGGMPVGAWRGAEQIDPLPSVLREPSPGEDRANTVAAWVCDLLDHGNAFGYITDINAELKAVSVQPVPATAVSVARTPDSGRVVYTVEGPDGTSRLFDRSEVFHAKGTSFPGGLRGLGVLEAGLGTLDRMGSESSYAARAFASGVPSGLLKVRDPDLQPGSDDDPPGFVTARGIKKQWQASVRTGEVAVMSELVDFTPLSWTPSDAQMVEARQLSLVDVANLFNVDPYWVGSSQVSAPYQNVQDAAVQLSRFTLGFWITALEAQFSRLLPRGQEARFNRDSILRDPQSVRVDNWTKLLAAGVVSVDEVRASEGLPPAPTPEPALPVAGVTPLFPAGDSGTNQAQVGA
jgi:HK97 family phage portal protein